MDTCEYHPLFQILLFMSQKHSLVLICKDVPVGWVLQEQLDT